MIIEEYRLNNGALVYRTDTGIQGYDNTSAEPVRTSRALEEKYNLSGVTLSKKTGVASHNGREMSERVKQTALSTLSSSVRKAILSNI